MPSSLKYTDRFSEFAAAVQEAKLGMLHDAAAEAVSIASSLSPVRTGTLRDSWYFEDIPDGVMVTSSADYAIFVELGHATRGSGGHVAPHPMLTPAIQAAGQGFPANFRERLEGRFR